MEDIKFNDGGSMPNIGFGTWQLQAGAETTESVLEAFRAGYRLIDTAKIYGNEASVGQAIRQSDLPRDEIFVTTKLWQGEQGYSSGLKAFANSLRDLNLDYIDLYLIHWPEGDRAGSWRALTEIHKDGRAKHIGVSNYTVRHLEELMADSELVPSVNQIEYHPFIYQDQKLVVDFCKKHDIVVEAYTPLARGQAMGNKNLEAIASKNNKTINQVLIRWAVQQGTVPLPRSHNPDHIKENFEIFDFKLSDSEMIEINKLSNGGRVSWDPTNIS